MVEEAKTPAPEWRYWNIIWPKLLEFPLAEGIVQGTIVREGSRFVRFDGTEAVFSTKGGEEFQIGLRRALVPNAPSSPSAQPQPADAAPST